LYDELQYAEGQLVQEPKYGEPVQLPVEVHPRQ
jgi:hypothetical protein